MGAATRGATSTGSICTASAETNTGAASSTVSTRTPRKQPVGVDAVGRTGDQRAQIEIGIRLEQIQLIGQDDMDLIHLIGQHLIQHAQGEEIAHSQLI